MPVTLHLSLPLLPHAGKLQFTEIRIFECHVRVFETRFFDNSNMPLRKQVRAARVHGSRRQHATHKNLCVGERKRRSETVVRRKVPAERETELVSFSKRRERKGSMVRWLTVCAKVRERRKKECRLVTSATPRESRAA